MNKPISSSEISSASGESKEDGVELQSLGVSVSSCPDITPEMILAGAYVLASFSLDEETHASAAKRVYEAMEQARKNFLNNS